MTQNHAPDLACDEDKTNDPQDEDQAIDDEGGAGGHRAEDVGKGRERRSEESDQRCHKELDNSKYRIQKER